MLEDELTAVAERVAPQPRPDLADAVLARLDRPLPGRRRRTAAVAAGTALVAALGLSPQVRAAATDLLDLAGIDLSSEEPDAAPEPREPLPGTQASDLDRAADAATFPLAVPAALGQPEEVLVVDDGRVVSMAWREGEVVLDQLDGSLGPVFEKEVGGLGAVAVEIGPARGWWLPGPHDLTYVDRDGVTVTATARLAGRTLVWEVADGICYRLEGDDLTRREALRIARSLTGTS